MTYGDYKHTFPIQIRFTDVDRLNHVNNACYLTYLELGRVHYLNTVLHKAINWSMEGLILARTEIDYKIPVLMQDEIYCCSRVIRLGTKSLTFKNAIIKKENGQLIECAAGTVILVAMNYAENRSIAIPGAWREQITAFEK